MGRSILAIQPFGVGARGGGGEEGRREEEEEEEGKNEARRGTTRDTAEEYCCAPLVEGGRETKEGTRNVSTFHNRLDCPNRSPTAFFFFFLFFFVLLSSTFRERANEHPLFPRKRYLRSCKSIRVS